ncbi:Predicted membrane protein [Raineyella antarctica]|uniref:Predicted membrane protein n=1 Tax=Raineyella antarctica TaxID=1577474 RepID=A0A1G6GD36_9ACTN|nr:DUF2142 domain-containing protein [Raineyella antarctica]SDB79880.1 Predicted membrane protein [Raineyella antarctica]
MDKKIALISFLSNRKDGFTAVLLIVATLTVGLAWVLASPVGSSPDEDYHMGSIWCPPPVESSGCRTGVDAEGASGVYVPALVRDASKCYAFHAEISAACMSGIPSDGLVLTTRVDHGEYPPYYYRFMHIFVGPDVTRSILVMRVVNVVLAVAASSVALLISSGVERRRWAAAIALSVVPLGLFLIASVNPSSWAVTGIAVLVLAMDALLKASKRLALSVASLTVMGGAVMAAGARVDGALYVILTLVVMSIVHGVRSYSVRSRILAPVLAAAFAGWSFLNAGSGGFSVTSGVAASESPFNVLYRNILELPNFLLRLYSDLGWLDTSMPPLVRVTMGFLAATMVMIGITQLNLRKSVALLIAGGAIVMLPLIVAQRGLVLLSAVDYPQPRYVLPLAAVLLFVALAPGRASVVIARPQRVSMYLLLVGAHSLALLTNIRRYTSGVGGGASLSNVQWWWPAGPGPFTLWGLASLAFAIAALVLLMSHDPVAVSSEARLAPKPRRALSTPIVLPNARGGEAVLNIAAVSTVKDVAPDGGDPRPLGPGVA